MQALTLGMQQTFRQSALESCPPLCPPRSLGDASCSKEENHRFNEQYHVTVVYWGFFPACMDSLLLVQGDAKRRGSYVSWGTHSRDSSTECLLWSCLQALLGRNRCSCPVSTCTPQPWPTNLLLLLCHLTEGLPVPNSLSCPLRGWEQ